MSIAEDAAIASALLNMAVAEVTAVHDDADTFDERNARRLAYHRAARKLMDRVAAEVLAGTP